MPALTEIQIKTISGEETTLDTYAGRVRLVVNVASKCGLTPQYEGLERLYEKYREEGLEVLGFPANDFRAQEPGTDAEIGEFCQATYGVKFPMFSKIAVTGEDRHPLYEALTLARPNRDNDHQAFRDRLAGYGINPVGESDVLWNFEKFLIGRDGRVAGRFSPDLDPEAPDLVAAIERELAKPA